MRKKLKISAYLLTLMLAALAAQSAFAVSFSYSCKNNTVYINTLDDDGHIIGTRWYHVTSCQAPA